MLKDVVYQAITKFPYPDFCPLPLPSFSPDLSFGMCFSRVQTYFWSQIIRNRSLTRISSFHFCPLVIRAVSYSCRTDFRLSKINILDYKSQASLPTSEQLIELINIFWEIYELPSSVLALVYIGTINTVMSCSCERIRR